MKQNGLQACIRPVATMLLLGASVLASPAHAQSWQGIKDQGTQAGLTPSVVYDGDALANTSGGARRGVTYLGSLHLQMALDFDRLAGIPGLTGWVEGLWLQGGQATGLVGDAQGVSNVAGPAGLRPYEAWLQYNLLGSRVSLLAGLYDLNLEFYRLRSAGLFLNSSFGIGPEFSQSSPNGPSIFPVTSLGFRLAVKPTANTIIRTAIMDAVPLDPPNQPPNTFDAHNGVLIVTEAAYFFRPPASAPPNFSRSLIGRRSDLSPYEDKIALGGWYYTSSFNDLSAVTSTGAPVQRHGEAGAYALLDQTLYQSGEDPKRHVSGFLQLGVADQSVDRFARYIGAGLNAGGLVPSRPDDEFGVAVAIARNGNSYMQSQLEANQPVTRAETTVEISYLSQLTPWLAMQPDLQWVFSPNTDPRRRTAIVAQLHFEASF